MRKNKKWNRIKAIFFSEIGFYQGIIDPDLISFARKKYKYGKFHIYTCRFLYYFIPFLWVLLAFLLFLLFLLGLKNVYIG